MIKSSEVTPGGIVKRKSHLSLMAFIAESA